jgi:hypothetical protein
MTKATVRKYAGRWCVSECIVHGGWVLPIPISLTYPTWDEAITCAIAKVGLGKVVLTDRGNKD